MARRLLRSSPRRESGVVAAEMAVTMVVFIALVVAVVEFARIIYVFSAATEATRLGARLAATCSTDSTVTSLVNSKILNIGTSSYQIVNDTSTSVSACDATNTSDCQSSQLLSFKVKSGTVLSTLNWFIPDFSIPSFTTVIPVEYSGC